MSRRVIAAAIGAVLAASVSACATTLPGGQPDAADAGTGLILPAAASINAWGSILSQLGGRNVHATSIITNPATDPHAYEPTPADGRTIAMSRLFVENGIGYDPWAAQAVRANPDPARIVLDVGTLVGVADGGNPHRWYSPSNVETVAAAITAALKRLDPGDARYFDARHQDFETSALGRYRELIRSIRTRYNGTAIGASESIAAPIAQALGLDLRTPPGLLKAISEGADPSAADKATADSQIAGREIKVYLVNSQNSTPDVAAQVAAARKQRIPVVAVTETLAPAGASFQDWQSAQLQALQAALARATGR